ncbi:MAG: diguanylate cyclase [Bacteroidales bacterium]|nr:diguanylate cyclase [Bacteroidales bacterium]
MKTIKRVVDAYIELSLKDSEIRYRRLFETAQDGILILEAQTGAIIDVNPFLIGKLGYSRDEFIGKMLWEMGSFKDIENSKTAFQALQKNKYIRYKDLPLRSKDGQLFQVEFVSNVYDEGSQKVIQCNIRDTTERKQAEDAHLKSEAFLREQSVRDHLTGLFNRRYMEETLERELVRADRKNLILGIIMLDVDNFRQFNETFGHFAGDQVLRELGNFFLQNIRKEDIACRYGGDEFILVLPDASRNITWKRANFICERVKHMQIQFEGQSLAKLSLSLGVAFYPADGTTSEEILKAADRALYFAKHEGRGRVGG